MRVGPLDAARGGSNYPLVDNAGKEVFVPLTLCRFGKYAQKIGLCKGHTMEMRREHPPLTVSLDLSPMLEERRGTRLNMVGHVNNQSDRRLRNFHGPLALALHSRFEI